LHGGRIDVVSPEGGGTSITAHLPSGDVENVTS